jgi:hypothetical protein
MKTRNLFLSAAAWAAVNFFSTAEACSVCISGVAGERLMDAINWSVIFLMAVPYTILFSVLGVFVYAYRRAAKKARTEELPVLNPASDLS